MKYPNQSTLLSLFIAGCTMMALVSCAVPDPEFLANARNIQDIEYPKNKIVGTWVHVSIANYRTNNESMEHKHYFEIRPNGRGTTRQVAINKLTGGHLSSQGEFTWGYLGKNKWRISLPGTAEYRTTDSHLMSRDTRTNYPGRDHFVSYYNDELYDFEAKRILVRATAENVAQLAERMRRNTPVFHINTQSR